MSFDRTVRFSGKFFPPTPDFPQGLAKPSTTESSKDGSPWSVDLIKEYEAIVQGLIFRANVTISGNPDTVLVSDTLNALDILHALRIPSISGIESFIGVQEGQVIFLESWRPGLNRGGQYYKWAGAQVRTSHDGGTILSPGRSAPTDFSIKAQIEAYLATVVDASTGCWVLIGADMSADIFGGAGDLIIDDSPSVIAAVSFANINSQALFWPTTYLTTETIPNFHDVLNFGPGGVKRGSDTFFPNPQNSNTNRLYVDPAGSDTNDGFSSSEPVADYGVHLARLTNYEAALNGTWELNFAPGTYPIVVSGIVPNFQIMRNPLKIVGPDVGGHPNVPTAIIDGQNNSVIAFLASRGVKLFGKDIKIIRCKPAFSGGFHSSVGGYLNTDNVHGDDNTGTIFVSSGSHIIVDGGIIDSNTGDAIGAGTNCTGTIGSNAARRTVISNGTGRGIFISESSDVHVDFVDVEDNTEGLVLDANSRCNMVNPDFKRNGTAVKATGGSIPLNTGAVFNQGTPDANTNDYILSNSMLPQAEFNNAGVLNPTVFKDFTQDSHTGDLVKTLMKTANTIPNWWFVTEDRDIEIEIWGEKTTSVNNFTLFIDIGGVNIIAAVTSGGSPTHIFHMKAYITQATPTQQRSWYTFENNLQPPRMGDFLLTAFDPTTDSDIEVSVQLADASDNVQINGLRVKMST